MLVHYFWRYKHFSEHHIILGRSDFAAREEEEWEHSQGWEKEEEQGGQGEQEAQQEGKRWQRRE